MKKLLSVISICSIAALAVVASSAYADSPFVSKNKNATIRFVPEEKGQQYFWCQVSDPTATVIVQTHNIDGQGLCPSGNATVSGVVFNADYFTVNGAGIDPSVTLTVSTGHFIGCQEYGSQNPPSGLIPYGDGQKFCSIQPKH